MGFSRQEYWSGVPLPSPIIWMVTENLESFHQLWSLGSSYWRHWRGWSVCNKRRIRLADPTKTGLQRTALTFHLANKVLFFIFFNLFYWSIVDLQCWVNLYCKRDSTIYSPIYIIFLYSFPFWLTTGYWMWFLVLYGRTLLLNQSVCNSLNLLPPSSQSILHHPLPWQTQVYTHVCESISVSKIISFVSYFWFHM